MGKWSRNFLVHGAPAAAVRDRFVVWMERRGFDLMTRPPLFDCDKQEERCAFLFSNARWTAVIYNEAFMEGDRALSELSEFPRVVEVWVGDSDDWGYALYEQGEFACGSTLNQEHEASMSPPPASAEDAAKLCAVLGISERLGAVLQAQRKRHLFADVPCDKFCQAIEAEAATFTAGDLEQWNEGKLASRDVAGWHFTPLYFEKHRPLGEEPAAPMLHAIAVRSFTPRGTPPALTPEMEQLIQSNVRMLRMVVLPIRWIVTPIVWLFVTAAMVPAWLGKIGIKFPTKPAAKDSLLSAIASRGKPWRREGEWLINERHGCRIRVPLSEAERKPTPFIFGVFTFSVGANDVICAAVRPATVRKIFDLRPQQVVVCDESFLVGQNAARKLVIRTEEKNGASFHYLWFVELPCAIYQFTLFMKSKLPDPDERAIDAIVRSFESVGDVQKPEAATN